MLILFLLLKSYIPYIPIYTKLKSCCCSNLITNSGQVGRPCRPNWIINNKNRWELERDTIGVAAWWRCRWKVWWIPQYYQHRRTTTISRPTALCQYSVLYIDIYMYILKNKQISKTGKMQMECLRPKLVPVTVWVVCCWAGTLVLTQNWSDRWYPGW